MKSVQFLAALFLFALGFSFVSAYDTSPLQDFCVAIDDPEKAVFVNGKFCKNPNATKPEDFFGSGLNIPGNTSNPNGFSAKLLDVSQIPGVNTLGISAARIDYAPNGGLVPPHTHPRGSEIIIVVKGTLYAGFITSDPDHRLITKILYPGDAFVFPIGLIHFQFNLAKTPGVAFASLNSQNPGFVTLADSLFGSKPLINPDVLAKAFKLDKGTVEQLQKKFQQSN